jgi:hypothetical protein
MSLNNFPLPDFKLLRNGNRSAVPIEIPHKLKIENKSFLIEI